MVPGLLFRLSKSISTIESISVQVPENSRTKKDDKIILVKSSASISDRDRPFICRYCNKKY